MKYDSFSAENAPCSEAKLASPRRAGVGLDHPLLAGPAGPAGPGTPAACESRSDMRMRPGPGDEAMLRVVQAVICRHLFLKGWQGVAPLCAITRISSSILQVPGCIGVMYRHMGIFTLGVLRDRRSLLATFGDDCTSHELSRFHAFRKTKTRNGEHCNSETETDSLF